MPIIKATLISRDTLDGISFIHDRVPLGKVYWIDPETIRDGHWFNKPTRKTYTRPTVTLYEGPNGGFAGHMPLEHLKVEES